MAIAAVGALALSAYKAYDADEKNNEAKQGIAALNANKPFYKIQDEFYNNRDIAASRAETGLPQATLDYMTNESQRGLGAGIQGIVSAGGNPNDIANLFDSYDRSIDRTAAMNAEAQMKNIQYYMDANSKIGAEGVKKWAIDEYQPWQNQLKELTQRRNASEQNFNNALNEGVGAISAGQTSVEGKIPLASSFMGGKSQEEDPYPIKTMSSVSPRSATSVAKTGIIPNDERLPI